MGVWEYGSMGMIVVSYGHSEQHLHTPILPYSHTPILAYAPKSS
jgi:hypothetical protein